MNAEPTHLIECATRISELGTDDATCRAAVSRAYYAAYHAAKRFHESLAVPGYVKGASGRHQQLLNQLAFPGLSEKNERFAVSAGLAKTLRPIYAARVDADYHLNIGITPDRTQEVLKASAEAIDIAERWQVKKAA